jgi:excisionase family DNA binding protein
VKRGFRKSAKQVEAAPLALLTPLECSRRLGVGVQTVKRLAANGEFSGAKIIGSAGWRIPSSSIDEFITRDDKKFISTQKKHR